MITIIKKMFTGRILLFYETMNQFIRMLTHLPTIGEKINRQVVEKNNYKLSIVFGVIAQIGRILYEFIGKFLYVFVFMYIPYKFIAQFYPLVAANQELTMIFFFFILSTICGSLANTIVLAMGDREYMMVKVFLISPYICFLGNIIYKVITDFIYFTIILFIFGVSLQKSLLLCFVTMMFRPIGEMLAIFVFDSLKKLYNKRGLYNGFVMALCFIFAYGTPIMEHKIPGNWLFVIHPVFIVISIVIGIGASIYLWWYKDYRKIMSEAMYIKREK